MSGALAFREEAIEFFSAMGLPRQMLEMISITEENALELEKQIKAVKPTAILEIGSFVGVSSAVIAQSMSAGSTLVSVDPCLSIAPDAGEFSSQAAQPNSYYFDSMLRALLTGKKIIRLKGFFSRYPTDQFVGYHGPYNPDFDSLEVVSDKAAASGPYDLIFLDADHYSASVRSDLNALFPMLSDKGRVIIHDMEGDWATEVGAGVDAFMNEIGLANNLKISIESGMGILLKE